ncbi:glycosyltransferase [Aurantibacillus circumpalustris]|uniref:glycosyltransferase n=1 Tax=Aurantibacillus circumpalustris TaxID=3036359 RepID=UPI00295AD995|nr:glycosyltransferase [Aurantibacillus circumpalustris]
MSGYSIIVPSFNQEKFIKETLENLATLKAQAENTNVVIQIIVVDNCSSPTTLKIINDYKGIINNLIIEKDKGQYDAINKGLNLVKGEFWTWLNTDDLIDIPGFFKLAEYLEDNHNTDYIYGDVSYIDENSVFHKNSSSGILSFEKLLENDASISQPGSFFRTKFTREIGELLPFNFAFDYEYILRCLKNEAKIVKLDTVVAYFRYYKASKSGSQDYRFLKEQLKINKLYGGKFFSNLSLILRLRILKRKLFN